MSPVRLGLALSSILLAAGLIAIGATSWWLGGQLFAPHPYRVGPPPPGLGGHAVSFPSQSGSLLHGWLFPGRGDAGVVLMHGSSSRTGGDRRSMMGRVPFLHDAGYTTLVFDFQANGESPGRLSTSGYLESLDAQAAVDYLRQQVAVSKVAVIGFSLGGAAALLGPAGPLKVQAMVLEAVYPTIEEAVANRIRQRLGTWSGWLYPLLTWQMGARFGVPPAVLRPIDRIGQVQAPVFIIAGAADPLTPLPESLRLFAAAPEPKELWAVPGAGHGEFHSAAPQDYEHRVLAFLSSALARTTAVPPPSEPPPLSNVEDS